MNINQFTNQELADIHLCYGLAGQNRTNARHIYQSRFPNHRLPSVEIFEQTHQILSETGSFNAQPIPRKSLSLEHRQKRLQFCHWFENHGANFSHDILFTDEQQFKGNGVNHNYSINVWCGIFGQHLIGPVFLPLNLKGDEYLTFLRDSLSSNLHYIPPERRKCMWYMHDGAPPHSCQLVQNYLNKHFSNRWIGPGGSVAWPPYSPDLNPIDFYVWDKIKSSIDNVKKINSVGDYENQFYDAFNAFRSDARHFDAIAAHLDLRISMCIVAEGDSFGALHRNFFRNAK